MFNEAKPPEGFHWEMGRCPNAREDGVPVACNCPGYCKGRWVCNKHEWVRFSSFGDPYKKCATCGMVDDLE